MEALYIPTLCSPLINHCFSETKRFDRLTCLDVSDDFVDDSPVDVTFDGSRYVVKLPVKPHHESIPGNFDICRNRLKSLKRKLDTNEMFENYGRIFKDCEEANIIENVVESDFETDPG